MPAGLKQPLAVRVAVALREAMERGFWSGRLPAERQLCRDLGVGRHTVRAALAILKREGRIGDGVPGRSRTIVPAADANGTLHRVILLTPFPPDDLPPLVLRLDDDLRRYFDTRRFSLDVMTCRAYRDDRAEGSLQRLVEATGPAIWLLMRATPAMQAWFAARRLPAVIIGYAHEGIQMPTITENLRAAARHAVGLLLARGHRHIALLHQGSTIAGHVVVEDILRERLREHSGAELLSGAHDGTPAAAAQAIALLLQAKDPPTALIAIDARDVITVATWMAQGGRQIPRDLSVVALFDDTALDRVIPPVTRYRVDRRAVARRIAETAMAVGLGRPPPRYQPLVPELIEGASIVPVPRQAR